MCSHFCTQMGLPLSALLFFAYSNRVLARSEGHEIVYLSPLASIPYFVGDFLQTLKRKECLLGKLTYQIFPIFSIFAPFPCFCDVQATLSAFGLTPHSSLRADVISEYPLSPNAHALDGHQFVADGWHCRQLPGVVLAEDQKLTVVSHLKILLSNYQLII